MFCRPFSLSLAPCSISWQNIGINILVHLLFWLITDLVWTEWLHNLLFYCMCPSMHPLTNIYSHSKLRSGVKINILHRPRKPQLVDEFGSCVSEVWEMLICSKCCFKMWWLADGSLLDLSTAHYRNLNDYFLRLQKESLCSQTGCIITPQNQVPQSHIRFIFIQRVAPTLGSIGSYLLFAPNATALQDANPQLVSEECAAWGEY